MFEVGDKIKVKRCRNKYKAKGYADTSIISEFYTTEEEITAVFESMDKTYKCFYIKGCNELITEKMIIK